MNPQDEQNINVYLNFGKLSIKSDPGTSITVSKGDYNYSIEQSSGLDVMYLPELGNWTMNAGDITKTISVFTYKQYDVNTYPYKVMTAIIDQSNSNPATCVTYTDDAASMTRGSDKWDEFFGHYPCLFKNGIEVKRLNPNNFAQFEDGTPADITSGDMGDVMIAFPRRGLKLETINNKVYVKMTDDPNNSDFGYLGHTKGEEQKEIFYVAAFAGSVKDGRLRSLPNVNPTDNTNISTFRNYAQANGEGYQLWSFYQLTFTQAMYVLKYANLDSQSVTGYGRCDLNTNSQPTGSTIDKGMDYGNNSNTSMKLFGIEDFYGNTFTFIDGLGADNGGKLAVATTNFNNSFNGYTKYNTSLPMGTYSYIKSVEGTTELGFVAKTVGGSEGLYFADENYFGFPGIFAVGGTRLARKAGIFLAYARDPSYSTSNFGTRCAWF